MAGPFHLVTENNVIRLSGGFAIQDVRKAIAALYSMIHDRGYPDIELDFSRVTFAHAQSMLPFIAQLELHRREGIDFSLALPQEEPLSRLFLNCNWAYFIDPNHFERGFYNPRIHNPVRKFSDATVQNAVVNEVVDTLLQNFRNFDRSHLQAIEWSLNEITDNVLVHARSSIGGLVQVTAIRNKQRVEFVVTDGGVGIAQSLRVSHGELNSDVDALSRAIEEGFTRDKSVGQGNGLFGSYQIAVTSGGNFSIHANRSTLYFTESSGMHTKAETVPFPGSTVVCGIDYRTLWFWSAPSGFVTRNLTGWLIG